MKLYRLFSTLRRKIHCPEIKLSIMSWSSPSEIPKEIPVISLLHDSESEQLRKMQQVAESSSCFFIKDYGISEDLLEDVINNAGVIFSSENFHRYVHPCVEIGPRGVHLMGSSDIEWYFEPCLDQLGITMNEIIPEPELDKFYRYYWLGCENIYPTLKFEEIYEEYYDEGYKIGEHLTNLVRKSINTNDPLTLCDETRGEIGFASQFYQEEESNNCVRLAPHVDPGTLTMLYQTPDENGKNPLEILYKGNYIGVPAIRGHQLVNFGEVINSISQSEFKAVVHRVANLKNSSRWSIPFAFNPTNETVMRKPPETYYYGGYTDKGVTTFEEFSKTLYTNYNRSITGSK